ncbi:hypothetical protein LMK05_07260 [Lactococcus petauri]|nr:hypothetical protein LMK05_07260 [Lactococcus petauri]
MSKRELWQLKKFSSETKKIIQEMAKEKGMFANDFVEEILDHYINDEELGKNKNFFDQRWQEVINSMELFTEAQQSNTEMWVQELQTLNKNLQKFESRLLNLEEEIYIYQVLIKKLLGIESVKEFEKEEGTL